MNSQRVAVVLTSVNLALIIWLVGLRPGVAAEGVAAAVLRGRALELVDDRGRVRAELQVLPAQPNVKMPDGTTGHPEVVQLRLIDSSGGPNVKLVATEDGAALYLGGEQGYVQILSRGGKRFLKLVDSNGQEKVIDGSAAEGP